MKDTNGYERLSNAIVRQAAEDYLTNKRKLYLLETYVYKNRRNKRILGKKRIDMMFDCEREIADCVRFFKDEWCMMLGVDGMVLLEKLDQELKETTYLTILKAIA